MHPPTGKERPEKATTNDSGESSEPIGRISEGPRVSSQQKQGKDLNQPKVSNKKETTRGTVVKTRGKSLRRPT